MTCEAESPQSRCAGDEKMDFIGVAYMTLHQDHQYVVKFCIACDHNNKAHGTT